MVFSLPMSRYHPIPRRLPEWSITLAEIPVHDGRAEDIKLYGREFSHPCLLLREPGGLVISQVHAAPRVSESRRDTTALINRFTRAVKNEKVNLFLLEALGEKYPRTSAFLKASHIVPGDIRAEQILMSGAKPAVAAVWRALIDDMIPQVQKDRKPYYRYATQGSGFSNCQTELRIITDGVFGAGNIPPLKLAQTGWSAPMPVLRGCT